MAAEFSDFLETFILGNTHRILFTVSLSGADQDLASWQRFRFTAKLRLSDTDTQAVLALADGGGGIVRLDPNADPGNLGKLEVTIPAAATASLANVRQLLYADLQGQDQAGDVWTLQRGTLTLLQRVTLAVS